MISGTTRQPLSPSGRGEGGRKAALGVGGLYQFIRVVGGGYQGRMRHGELGQLGGFEIEPQRTAKTHQEPSPFFSKTRGDEPEIKVN